MKMILAAMIFAVTVGIILTVVGLTTSHASEPDSCLRKARAWPFSCDYSAVPQETLSLNARA